MQRGDRRKANHTDQKQNASDLSLDGMAGGVYLLFALRKSFSWTCHTLFGTRQ